MSFVDQNLLEGEEVVYRTRVHWKIFMLPLFFAIVALVFLVSRIAIPEYSFLWIPALIFAVVALLVFVERWIRYTSSEFAVTNRRVLIKVGIVRRRSLELIIDKVEGIGVEQSIPGRMFGFGSIVVTGTGGTRESFQEIRDPLEFRKQVQARIGAATPSPPDAE